MHPVLAARFAKLEERRHAMVRLVSELPLDRRGTPPDPKSFSPAETISHMALAEEHDLVQMRRVPPSELVGKRAGTNLLYRFAVRSMQNVKRIPTMKNMTPAPGASVAAGSAQWEEVRAELAGFLEQATDPDAAFCKLRPFGTLSASNLLELLEAHMHYHETLLSG